MDAVALLTDDFLADHFDAGTLARARDYVGIAVEDPEVSQLSAGSVTATADVRGTRADPYQVQLHAEVDPGVGHSWIFSVCSCPVRSMCKHGAALAITLRQQAAGTAGGTPWQRRMNALAEELTRHAGDETAQPVALQIGLGRPSPRSGAGAPAPTLRPLRPGAKQRWVRTGATWADVPGLVARQAVLPDQAEALEALSTELRHHRGWETAGSEPSLAAFGPRLPRLLRAAADAGIELVPTRPLTAVTVATDRYDLVADLTTEGAATLVRLGVAADDTLWCGDDLWLLGNPARVAAHLAGGELRIAELTATAHRVARELATGAPIEVPTGELPDLLERLPALVRHLGVRSSDGSVDVPTRLRPALELTVTWDSGTDAELAWEWRYGTDRCALDASGHLGGVRDRVAEREIRTRLPARLLGRTGVSGPDALGFALHDLPHLRGIDDVTVVEVERPHFREASEAPEISFDVADSESEGEHTDWLDLEVTVTVEGELVALPAVLAALTLGQEHLVLPSGLYVTTDRPEFTRLREVVTAAAELRETAGDRVSVGKHDLGVWAQLAELGIVDSQADAWVSRARALRDLTDLPRPEPRGLATELRTYQRDGFSWLAFLHEHSLGGVLADDMGLGKTLQVLAMIQHAVTDPDRPPTSPYLVVAPTSVVTAWRHEAVRHTPGLRVGVVTRGSDDLAVIAAESHVVVTTYTQLRLTQERYAALPWAGLVLDEAQQVKNHQSKTYAAVRGVDAPFRLVVTGTPFENRLMELWTMLSIATPGLYPWPQRFRDQVVRPVEKEGDQAALHRFRQRIRPFLLRRTKELVAADLPPKQEQVLEITLEPRHRTIYDAHLAKERQRILGLVDDFDRNRVRIFSALTRLRQLALDPALVDAEHESVGSAKLDVLARDLAEVTAEGHQALVFSQFTSFLERVRDRLDEEGITTTYLDGATRDRDAVIERFRDGAASVFLISLKAGGVGLTLTEADYVFVLDPWWNPAAEAQAVDRAHRIGQSKYVNVYRLVATDTIEEKVMALKERKAELFARVVDGDGAMSTGLDAEDIRALFD